MFFRIAQYVYDKIFFLFQKVFYDGFGKKSKLMIDLTIDKGFWNILCQKLYNINACKLVLTEKLSPRLNTKNTKKLTPVWKKFFLSRIIVIALLLVFFIFITSLALYFIVQASRDDHGILKADTLAQSFSAIGTCLAAIYAGKSAKGVYLSNKSIEENNKKESFDRLFSVLLEQHSMYLNKVNNFLSESKGSVLFSVEYLRDRTISESISIVHGESSGVDEEGYYKIIYSDERERDDEKKYKSIESTEIDMILKNSNDFAKNTLSPYMRILYHILKSIHEFLGAGLLTASEEEKQYSNIIRSTIPSNLMFLIARNSAGFFSSSRAIQLFRDQPSDFASDYYKYFYLLRRYDFFEHLPNSYLTHPNGLNLNHSVEYKVKTQGELVKIKDEGRVIGIFLPDPVIYDFSCLVREINSIVMNESTLNFLSFYYNIGENLRDLKKYFKHKYIIGLYNKLESVDANDIKGEANKSYRVFYNKNDDGYMFFMGDLYIESLICGNFIDYKYINSQNLFQ